MNYLATYNEEDLTRLLHQDEEAAFTEIYNRYWDRLYALAYLRLQSSHSAEDIVQEVFSDLWKRRRQVYIGYLHAYLATAVKYAVIRHVALSTRKDLLGVEVENIAHRTENNDAEFRFLQQMMQQEISRLPKKCRIVFLFSREYDLSYKEIAHKMHISEKMVEKHISTALRRLRFSFKHLPFFFFF